MHGWGRALTLSPAATVPLPPGQVNQRPGAGQSYHASHCYNRLARLVVIDSLHVVRDDIDAFEGQRGVEDEDDL